MATSVEFIEYVCDQIKGAWDVRHKKMFGEYMIYVNDKPLFLVCDATVYVKQHPCLLGMMQEAPCGIPYKGAKEQYILDVDDTAFNQKIIQLLEPVIALPKPRKSLKAKNVTGK